MSSALELNIFICSFGVLFLLPTLISIYIFFDARNREGYNPVLWFVITLITGWVGIAIYFMMVITRKNSHTQPIDYYVDLPKKKTKVRKQVKKSGPVERF